MVHRPDADPVSFLDTEAHERPGYPVYFVKKLAVGEPDIRGMDTIASLSGYFAAMLSTISPIVIPSRGTADVPHV